MATPDISNELKDRGFLIEVDDDHLALKRWKLQIKKESFSSFRLSFLWDVEPTHPNYNSLGMRLKLTPKKLQIPIAVPKERQCVRERVGERERESCV